MLIYIYTYYMLIIINTILNHVSSKNTFIFVLKTSINILLFIILQPQGIFVFSLYFPTYYILL